MKTYTLPGAAMHTHPHPHPMRTAYRRATSQPMDFDFVCKVWPSRASMLETIRQQEQRERMPGDWRPLVRP